MLGLKMFGLLGVLVGALIAAWQMARLRRRMAEPTVAGQCIACDSHDLESLGPDAYRCRQCGYEGGEGLRVQLEDRAAAAYAGLDVEQRQRLARQRLHDALHTLMAAPRRAADAEELDAWVSAVDEVALRGAGELDDAKRAAGGVVDLPQFGELDPSVLAQRLRSAVHNELSFTRVDARKAHRALAAIEHVAGALEQALAGVVHERSSGGATGYRG